MNYPGAHGAFIALTMLLLALVGVPSANADDEGVAQRLLDLETKIERLETTLEDIEEAAGIALLVLFLFGTVLAMRAQRRGDSGCLWFILGLIPGINIIAAITALAVGDQSRSQD